MLTLANILVDKVHTLAAILAGVAVALIELVLAAVAGVARIAVTRVTGNAIYASAMVAWVRLAVIDVALAQPSLKPWGQKKETRRSELAFLWALQDLIMRL